MTISYNWLSDYLPEKIDPDKLSKILTSIGLEVESLEKYEKIKGGLKGLVVGEVITCQPHPNADKLKLTTINTGESNLLQIVCGAPNVAVGQKVIVATVGSTIYPLTGEPITLKVAKIRGVESQGMLCAEDEIGIGQGHAGILVLPKATKVGMPASEYFATYEDWIYEIGLTPNRMDAMSHMGVAKDVCAYLTHHNKKETRAKSPYSNSFKVDNHNLLIKVLVENTEDCLRYSGVSISNITIKESPQWLKDRLVAIGLRSINNIVDITNYILHETGQPLHAFDAAAITGDEIIVKNLPKGSSFTTIDEKERKLFAEDLVICNAENGMCIAGVFGGLESGVKDSTKNIFLESACFNPISVRKTALQHGLRTDAAARFEKGVDISGTVNVLKRAALLIKEVAGGEISSDIIDIYPNPQEKVQVALKHHYLKKLSGKNYHADAVNRILTSLGFEILKEGMDELRVAVPFSKPDITLPADIVEEIVRIDGLDNIEIPVSVHMSPAVETTGLKDALKEKLSNYLVGQGFHEIMTNSITNSKYFSNEILDQSVKMINNLSADLDVLRPSMLETGLEAIAYNNNRKNNNLQLFEFGKTYHSKHASTYNEAEHLCLYITGDTHEDSWNEKSKQLDFFRAKGLANAISTLSGCKNISFKSLDESTGSIVLGIYANKELLGQVAEINKKRLQEFDIKQPVYFVDIAYGSLLQHVEKNKIIYTEVSKFPSVERDLSLVIDSTVSFESIEKAAKKTGIAKLKTMQLFDIFESDKIGLRKKSVGIKFIFLDEEKTLTDKETDSMIQKLIQTFESELAAEIRK